MKKIYYTLLTVIIVFLFALIALYNKYYNKQNNDTKITVAEVTHSVFYAPFYVALHNNYFEEEGLDIDVILTSGADKVASAVLSDDAQIGLSGLEATLYVYKNNAKDYLVNFSALTKRDGQFLFGDCNLKDNFSINDLKGKRILAGRTGGMPEMVFRYALYKNNVNKNDVIIDNSIDFASLSGAYIGGNGDFVNLFEPTALSLEKEGYGCVLASLGLMSGELPYTVFHTKKSYLDNNKDTIKKFTNAINKGLDFTKENDSEKIATIIKDEFASTSLEDLTEVIERYKNADSWWDNTFISEDAYNNLINLMIYNNALEEKYDYKDLVVNSFNE